MMTFRSLILPSIQVSKQCSFLILQENPFSTTSATNQVASIIQQSIPQDTNTFSTRPSSINYSTPKGTSSLSVQPSKPVRLVDNVFVEEHVVEGGNQWSNSDRSNSRSFSPQRYQDFEESNNFINALKAQDHVNIL